MRDYKSEVWDMFGNYFIEHKIREIPRREDGVVNYLVVAAGKFKIPTHS